MLHIVLSLALASALTLCALVILFPQHMAAACMNIAPLVNSMA